MYKQIITITAGAIFSLCACTNNRDRQKLTNADSTTVIKPLYVTDSVQFDTDDPAIWINAANPAQSLVIGTDKNENGGLYVFDLKGKILQSKVVHGLKRPNNVD